uniref:Uncharacterized protein n=1 Tax=Anguilla anguilla TaxID=7936 RepID=A0A0E9W473_ANGAN
MKPCGMFMQEPSREASVSSGVF